jgi:hypothetical protein
LFVSSTWSPIALSEVFPSNTLMIVPFTAVTMKPLVSTNSSTQTDKFQLHISGLNSVYISLWAIH